MRVMRKPYKTPTFNNVDAKPLKSHGASECGSVLPVSKARKRIYLETILTVAGHRDMQQQSKEVHCYD
jgi:hypothetical protein